MKIALTVSPSFSDGFGVEISERRDPLRGSYQVIKTKWLDADSYVGLEKQAEIFGNLRTEQEIDTVDFETLRALVGAVIVSPPEGEWSYMDGTLIALSIERGAVRINLEWNSQADEKWKGVDELVEFLTVLYERHRRRGFG